MKWYVTANESWGVSKMKLHKDPECQHLERHREARDTEVEACDPCKTCVVWLVAGMHRSSGDKVYHTDPECSFRSDRSAPKAKRLVNNHFKECDYCAGEKEPAREMRGGHLESIREHVQEERGEDIFEDRTGFYAGEKDA